MRSVGLSPTIEHGNTTALTLGETSAGAPLEYGSVKPTDEMKSEKMRLPGRHVFNTPGLRIPPAPPQD